MDGRASLYGLMPLGPRLQRGRTFLRPVGRDRAGLLRPLVKRFTGDEEDLWKQGRTGSRAAGLPRLRG